jgi:TolA-binding protein
LKAQLAIAQEKWTELPPPLEQLVNEYPDSSLKLLAEYWLAEAAYRQDDHEQATSRLAALAKQVEGRDDKWLPMIPLRQAQILAHEKKWPEALELARGIEASFPGFEQQFEADYLIGRCLAGLGALNEAREAYLKVIRSPAADKTETAAMAQWMIGESYFHQRNYQAALREYLKTEILYAYPTWQAGALLQAGKCHELLGEWKQAGDLYARLLKIYPETPFVEEATQRLREAKSKDEKG